MSEVAVRWAEPGDAAAVADRIAAEVSHPGEKRIALPGGSTPLKIFDLLAHRSLDWAGTTLTLTDDREVPDEHPASNYGKLTGALGGSGAKFERIAAGMELAPFDLVWLGMGEDGHVASIFPHCKMEQMAGRRVIPSEPIPLPKEAPFPRLSLNMTALSATKELMLVVTGAAKKAVIERALAGEDLPVATLLQGRGAFAPPPVTIYWSA